MTESFPAESSGGGEFLQDHLVEFRDVGQEYFHTLDRKLMKHAFQLQNELGSLCDERIYQEELARRCSEAGIDCRREVELRARHSTFVKSYFLDLLLGGGAIYELKTTKSLSAIHHSQLINYLLLTGLHHGKLVNFRSASVESRFVSTRLDLDIRRNFQLSECGWKHTQKSSELKSTLVALLEDWGTFLDLSLYREALLHLLDGPDCPLLPVPIQVAGIIVGFQKMCLLDPEQAWHLSAIKSGSGSHVNHIKRLLEHTPLKMVHWINLHQNQITLTSLEK